MSSGRSKLTTRVVVVTRNDVISEDLGGLAVRSCAPPVVSQVRTARGVLTSYRRERTS